MKEKEKKRDAMQVESQPSQDIDPSVLLIVRNVCIYRTQNHMTQIQPPIDRRLISQDAAKME